MQALLSDNDDDGDGDMCSHIDLLLDTLTDLQTSLNERNTQQVLHGNNELFDRALVHQTPAPQGTQSSTDLVILQGMDDLPDLNIFSELLECSHLG